ncbi:lysophospholipid acyltransferase family protein [Flavobacteriaceae sp. LMIT009]
MKKLWLHTVRTYLRIGMFFYFKKLKVHGAENVPKDKPVLFLANHQNALLDALLIAGKCGRFSYFLTRAAVFKKSFVSKILKSLQMLPVYRVRDGWNTIANNNAIFETCSELLFNNEAVVIFPEGSHNLVRRVRPLSKGFTRIVFDTLEKYPNLDLQLVPVGLNFIEATSCPDSTAIFFGKSITANDFVNNKRAEGVVQLKQEVHARIAELTTHIPESNYDEILNELLERNVDLLNPKKANECIKTNFEDCKSKPKSSINGLRVFLKYVLILNLFVPYFIWKFLVKPKIKEQEFVSTFRFALALTLVPFYLIIICSILGILFGAIIGLLYLLGSLVLALVAIKA